MSLIHSVAEPIIIAHSISPEGIQLITWQLRYWRAIHAELMTHRVFSRNAGSSRARPSATIIDSVTKEPWGPMHWGKNQPGMQALSEHDELVKIPVHLNRAYAEYRIQMHGEKYEDIWDVGYWAVTPQDAWHFHAFLCGNMSGAFDEAGYHKQIVNRTTESVNYIDVVLTSTDFENWYALRDHPDAQPEIQHLASMMREVQEHSEPTLLKPGEWHLPYADSQQDFRDALWYLRELPESNGPVKQQELTELLQKASAARCARVSYKLHDGSKTDFDKDLDLFDRLLVSQPLHASPAEHQATPDTCYNYGSHAETWENPNQWGNFRGWRQFRKMLPNEYVPG